MTHFVYQALDGEGAGVSGVILADNFRQAARELEGRNLRVVQLEPKLLEVGIGLRSGSKKIAIDELILVFSEIVTMLRAGVGLKEIVEALCKSGHTNAIKLEFDSILKQLKNGETFSRALKNTRLPVPGYMHYLIEAAELTGSMAESLDQGVQQMEYELQVRSDTKSALIYPAILVFSGVVAVGIMFLFVVPKFSALLNPENELPFLADVVISSGVWVNENKLLVVCSFFVSIMLLLWGWRNENSRAYAFNLLSQAPVVGDWIRESDVAIWSKMLSVLLGSKVPMLDALSLSAKTMKTPWRKVKLSQVRSKVKTGVALSEAIEQEGVVTATTVNLIRVGERSGALPATLLSVANLYDKASKKRMKNLLALIEPIAILVIGSAVGVIIMGIILAITSANDIAI